MLAGEEWREFPPHVLREYALLADGERGALCGPRGDIVWLCAPRWDSDAVLSSLIGGGGCYAVTPVDPFVWGGYYEPGTLIWRSRWVTPQTTVECREALAFPGDPHRTVLLRRIQALEDTVTCRVQLDLRDGFGRRSMRELHRDDNGVWTARTGDLRVRWTGAGEAVEVGDGRLLLEVTVKSGRHHDLVLEIGNSRLGEPVDADGAWRGTEHSWSEAVPDFDNAVAPRDARHSYAVLRGLTSHGGGMVAAVTLGLPERAEAGRNYDYRYVWLRDQSYAGLAVSVEEPHPLLDAALSFVTARVLEHGYDIAPAYRVDGTALPHERELGLAGYPGGKDVVGNWVKGQFQLDTCGELLQLYAAAARFDRLETDARTAADVVVETIERRWKAPDAGVWELDDAWWTQSRLACVAGLKSYASHLLPSEAARLVGLADRILAETSDRCLDERGAWRRSAENDGVDASLVLPSVRGALAPDDPRTVATYNAVISDLTQDGYVYRFSVDDQPLGAAEGSFLLCGFMMALAAFHQGDEVAAFRWFERTRASCGPPGLLSEEYDVRQRQMRGNVPQAFVHAMLLEAAQQLSAPGVLHS